MQLLAHYDRATSALAEALRSTTVDVVLDSLDDLEAVKSRARRVQDRALLANATEFQMRVERRLGELLAQAHQAGHLREGRPKKATDGELPPATLKDIGVDKKLSMKAQAAARLSEDEFDNVVLAMREKMAAGKAIMVDPVAAAEKAAELVGRRQAHAERTKDGGSIADLGKMVREGRTFGSIGSDPQWKFLARSAAGEGRSANIHYKTEEVDKIKDLPVNQLLADDGAFYMWMVDWCPQDAFDLLAHWGLRHVTTAFTWIKTNGDDAGLDIWDDSTWHMGQGYWTRANPEQCLLATKGNPKRLHADVRQLIIAPVMEHSRKPDEWLDRIERLTTGDYLELQARRTRPGWVSWGDELEFTGVAA